MIYKVSSTRNEPTQDTGSSSCGDDWFDFSSVFRSSMNNTQHIAGKAMENLKKADAPETWVPYDLVTKGL